MNQPNDIPNHRSCLSDIMYKNYRLPMCKNPNKQRSYYKAEYERMAKKTFLGSFKAGAKIGSVEVLVRIWSINIIENETHIYLKTSIFIAN